MADAIRFFCVGLRRFFFSMSAPEALNYCCFVIILPFYCYRLLLPFHFSCLCDSSLVVVVVFLLYIIIFKRKKNFALKKYKTPLFARVFRKNWFLLFDSEDLGQSFDIETIRPVDYLRLSL